MTGEQGDMEGRAAALRAAFDQAFAAPPPGVAVETANFLGVRVGTGRYAIELSEIAGLLADRRIVSVPSAARGLLGVAALRQEIVPVYSLAILLDHAAPDARPRWLVLTDHGQKLAFAFDALEGHMRIPRADIAPAQGDAPGGHVRASAIVNGALRPILCMRSLIERLEKNIDRNDRQGSRQNKLGEH